jgi:hypothetical protein
MFTAVAPSLGLGAGPAVTDRRTPLASRARCRSRAPCSSRGRPVIVLAVSTNTNSNTNADTTVSTITSSSARGHFIVSETKAGVTQYSFAGPPLSHTEGEEGIRDEGERAAAFAGHPHVKKEVMFDVVLDCRGGVHVTGLVFVQGRAGHGRGGDDFLRVRGHAQACDYLASREGRCRRRVSCVCARTEWCCVATCACANTIFVHVHSRVHLLPCGQRRLARVLS